MEPDKIYPRVHEYGCNRNVYVPANPLGMSFYPLTNTRVQRVTLNSNRAKTYRVSSHGYNCYLHLLAVKLALEAQLISRILGWTMDGCDMLGTI